MSGGIVMDSKWKNSLCSVEFSSFLLWSRLQPHFLVKNESLQVSTIYVLQLSVHTPTTQLKKERQSPSALENKNPFRILCGKYSGERGSAVIRRKYEDQKRNSSVLSRPKIIHQMGPIYGLIEIIEYHPKDKVKVQVTELSELVCAIC